MFIKNGLFTSECVTKGHPDKVCDQISDAILDACLEQDPYSRVAVECMIGPDKLVIMGELSTEAKVDYEQVARNTLRKIGYTSRKLGCSADDIEVEVLLHEQSSDIAQGVDINGAGDQGMMYGYACKETPELMPYGFMLAKKLARRLEDLRESGDKKYSWMRPDAKTQVTVRYEDGKPVSVDTILVSCQHDETVTSDDINDTIMYDVIKPVIKGMQSCSDCEVNTDDFRLFVNPTGSFVIGGPAGDTGLTGRKIIVDTYGGYAYHGGGCFSGKDCTKVDRSAALMARKAAKWLVANGYCNACTVQVAYAIGVAYPVSLNVITDGSGLRSDRTLARIVSDKFDFTPRGIIEKLKLRKPIYSDLAYKGHFGFSDDSVLWEVVSDVN